MPIQHTASEKKWELLLKTIGAKEVEVTNVTDTKIIIKIDLDNLEYLRKLLESRHTLKKNTLHALLCNNQTTDQMLAIANDNNNYTLNIKNNDWFKKVVSDQFIKENNLSKVFDSKKLNVQFNEELLISQIQLSEPGQMIPYLLLRLNLAKLQAAITDESTLTKIISKEEPLIIAHNNVNPTNFAETISKIVAHDNNNTVDFIVNNGAFAQILQAYEEDGKPPIIASDLHGSFVVDKDYLLLYLSHVFNSIVWCEKEKVPIVFHAKSLRKIAAAHHDFNILIDTSGSMHPNFDAYKNNIKDILDKLGKIPNWQIKIVRFSSNSSERFFSLKNGHTMVDVKEHVDTFTSYGSTRLYCTLKEALEDIRAKLTKKPDLYSTLMVFTDGDNNEGCTEDDVINAASYLKIIPQFNMYAVGFGQTESGFQNFFKRISEEGGFVHIKLDDPSGMTQLQQYINLLTQKIDIWEILQGELKLSVARVPRGDTFVLHPGTANNDIRGMTCVKNNEEKFIFGTDCPGDNTIKPKNVIY